MKYMLLIATDPNAWASMSEEESDAMNADYFAFSNRIAESGEMGAGDPLHGVETATTVRVRDGVRSVTDGPFAETKEHFGGYYVVEVESLDRAIELAAEVPGARLGSIEVRPIMDFTQMS